MGCLGCSGSGSSCPEEPWLPTGAASTHLLARHLGGGTGPAAIGHHLQQLLSARGVTRRRWQAEVS